MRYDEKHGIVFFGWDAGTEDGDTINLSVSKDGGSTWTDCRAAVAPADSAGFVTADSDADGNIYLAYGEQARYHTYMVSLPAANVDKCANPAGNGRQPTVNPGFSDPCRSTATPCARRSSPGSPRARARPRGGRPLRHAAGRQPEHR
jgi:hypothetical protein